MFKFMMRAIMLLSFSLHSVLVLAAGPVNPITVTFQDGTTTFVTGATGTASYLVSVDPSVTPPGYPLTMSVNNLPDWATQITTGGTACTTAAATCGNLMSLSAGENCCLMLSLNGANLTAGSYSIAPIVATTPKATYQGQAAATSVTVTAAPQTTTISITPAATEPQTLTADGATPTPLVFTIRNTGATTATNITATQPEGWSEVNIVTSAGCASLAPATDSCTFTLTSSTPNLAKQFTVQGANTGTAISSPYVAFRTHGGLVFSVSGTSPATAKVVSETDNNRGIQWYNGTYSTTGAQSITDGYYNDPATGNRDTSGNTYKITLAYGLPNDPATYAAAVCFNNTASSANRGDWYLPAICELGTYNEGAGGSNAECGLSIANVETNLYNFGFLSNLSTTLFYWSSTEAFGLPEDLAWGQSFVGVGDSSQLGGSKNLRLGVRCVRAFTY